MPKPSLRILKEEELQALLDFVPFPTAIINKQEFLAVNKIGQSMLSSTHYNYSIPDIFYQFRNAEGPERKEILLMTPDLEKHWISMVGEPVWFRDTLCILGFIVDSSKLINAQHEAQRLAHLSTLMLEINISYMEAEDIQRTFHLILNNALKAIENAAMGSIMVLKDGSFQAVSYLGYGKDIETFKLPLHHAFLYRATDGQMDRIVNIPQLSHDESFYPITTYAGEQVYIQSHLAAPIYIKGTLYGMICLDSLVENAFDQEDVSAMEFIRSNVQIAIANQLLYIERSQQAMFDQLTGLYNRHYFVEHFEMIKNKALRYDESFHFVLFDIDKLKSVNDRYGHSAGDQVLVSVAQSLNGETRKSDVIVRYGGDEFVGIFFGATNDGLIEKFNHITARLASQSLGKHLEGVIPSFSFGIAQFPSDGVSIEDLLKIADERMYASKQNKRG